MPSGRQNLVDWNTEIINDCQWMKKFDKKKELLEVLQILCAIYSVLQIFCNTFGMHCQRRVPQRATDVRNVKSNYVKEGNCIHVWVITVSDIQGRKVVPR